MEQIYLDNAATTRPFNELNDLYLKYAQQEWHNPSSLYADGVNAQKRIDSAYKILSEALGSPGFNCFFTSGGTESANTVILNGAKLNKYSNLVCGGYEHPCVEESFLHLKNKGFEVRFIQPDKSGRIKPDEVSDAVDHNTALVSVMHVNNETGAINDIYNISARVKQKNKDALFHSDGVQAYVRVPANLSHVDYYTVSAHKIHALKGTGAVFYKPGSPLKPYVLGGGQEKGFRSGTQNTLGIAAFAEAVKLYTHRKSEYADNLKNLKGVFLDVLQKYNNTVLISPGNDTADHIVCAAFEGIAGETITHILENKGIFISTGAACSSKKGKTRAAKALGLPDKTARGIIRVSFSALNTIEQAITAAREINEAVNTLKKLNR